MSTKSIYITENDLRRLRSLIASMIRAGGEDEHRWQEFFRSLESALPVKSNQVPPDVVTMNSVVRIIDLETQEEAFVTLVFPHMADNDENRVSVLSQGGTALLGCREGDFLSWPVLDGTHQMKIVEVVYQPEAGGLISMDYTA